MNRRSMLIQVCLAIGLACIAVPYAVPAGEVESFDLMGEVLNIRDIPHSQMDDRELRHWITFLWIEQRRIDAMERAGDRYGPDDYETRRRKLNGLLLAAARALGHVPLSVSRDISRIMSRLDGLIDARSAVHPAPPSPTGIDPAAPEAVAVPAGPDGLLWPLERFRISSRFGPRLDPFTGRPEFHDGIDLAAPLRSLVRPAGAGVVVSAGFGERPGNYVVIRHPGGLLTAYAHLEDVFTFIGAEVDRGFAIGSVGHTGRASGPHLHFSVRRGNAYVDPEEIVSDAG